MGELGGSHRFENRRAVVTSGRIHAGSPDVTRSRMNAKKWIGLSDPELKRKKRIVKYKVYAVEGKVKTSFQKGIRWIKNKVSELVHGY